MVAYSWTCSNCFSTRFCNPIGFHMTSTFLFRPVCVCVCTFFSFFALLHFQFGSHTHAPSRHSSAHALFGSRILFLSQSASCVLYLSAFLFHSSSKFASVVASLINVAFILLYTQLLLLFSHAAFKCVLLLQFDTLTLLVIGIKQYLYSLNLTAHIYNAQWKRKRVKERVERDRAGQGGGGQRKPIFMISCLALDVALLCYRATANGQHSISFSLLMFMFALNFILISFQTISTAQSMIQIFLFKINEQ